MTGAQAPNSNKKRLLEEGVFLWLIFFNKKLCRNSHCPNDKRAIFFSTPLCLNEELTTLLTMKFLAFLVSLLIVLTPAYGAVYKYVDEKGNVIKYSDKPQKPGDKPISMPKPALEYQSKPAPETTPAPASEPTEQNPEQQEQSNITVYSAVAIIKPDDQATIRANGGSFPISVASEPALDTDAGHHYVVMLDGVAHQQTTATNFDLTGIDRGQHAISVEIQDQDGQTLVSSSAVTVFVHKASVLHRVH